MYVMSTWALLLTIKKAFVTGEGFHFTADPVPWVALVLVALALLMLIEAFKVFFSATPPESRTPEPVLAPAG
jgi:hypothetical protein